MTGCINHPADSSTAVEVVSSPAETFQHLAWSEIANPQAASRFTSSAARSPRSKPGRLAYRYVMRPALPLRLRVPSEQAGTAGLQVRNASRFTSSAARSPRSKPGRLAYRYVMRPALPLRLRGPSEQAGTACLQVRNASRFTSSAARSPRSIAGTACLPGT